VCVVRGMPSSCRSAGESDCVVLSRSACVCVCVWCRACLPVCMWVSVWCQAGPFVCVCAVCVCVYVCGVGQAASMCVIRGMLSSCRSAGQSE